MKKIKLNILFLLFIVLCISCKKNTNRVSDSDEYIKISGTKYDLNHFAYRYSDDTFAFHDNFYEYDYYGANGQNQNSTGDAYEWNLIMTYKSIDGSFGNSRPMIDANDLINNTNCWIYLSFGYYTNGNLNLPGQQYYSKANGTCTYNNGFVHFIGTFDAEDEHDNPIGEIPVEANLKFNN